MVMRQTFTKDCQIMIPLFILCILHLTNGAEIIALPGLNATLNFKHYSGYLQSSDIHHLHYIFTESQNDPAKDPLVLWLNGGPGCSSVGGLLTELGPYLASDDGESLTLNEFAWNKKANVFALEAPAGVGFSYSDAGTATGDSQTAKENYVAVKKFFEEFSQFKSNDFYVVGESYGGIYVPTLVSEIINGQSDYKINIKGFGIGNGCVDFSLGTDTLTEFAYNHGFIDERQWSKIRNSCCQSQNGCSDDCKFSAANPASICSGYVNRIQSLVWFGGMNPYDLYNDCFNGLKETKDRPSKRPTRYDIDVKTRFNLSDVDLAKLEQSKSLVSIPCLDESPVTNYLRRDDVRDALHIPKNVPQWEFCSGLNYKREFDNVAPQAKQALAAGLRLLFYYGDTDMACNFLLGQKFAERLQQKLQIPKKSWSYAEQVAGFFTRYENVDFYTVKGSGHMVPQFRPGPGYHLFNSWLEGKTP